METNKECCIISAGPSPAYYIDGCYCIAADAGFKKLKKLGVTPDLLIGDFDSCGKKPSFSGETITLPTEKDDTDTMQALKEAISRGYKLLYISGCFGGMLDHTVANIQSLVYAKRKGVSAFLVGEGETAVILQNEEVNLYPDGTERFSLFAIDGKAEGVSIAGAKYNCTDITLSCDFPLGVSNEFKDPMVTISVKNGTLLMIYQGLPDLFII